MAAIQEAPATAVGEFDFSSAIEAHRQWKVRLRSAIAEHGQLDAQTLCRDDRCPLGQWLHGPGGARWGQRPLFVELVERHATFHRTAADVAQTINRGQYDEARRLIGAGSAFTQVSTEVASLLTRAKREL
jgi:methyl-accepting chemotaxis protein